MNEQERKILIIDDSAEDRATYRRYLRQDPDYTYIVLEAEYGEEGLKMCRVNKPDSVLLDYRLPDLDGLEFLDELKDKAGKVNIPVVMVTGYGNEEIAVRAMKNGAQDYLVKGRTTPESLRQALRHAMEKAELLRKLAKSEQRFRTSVENMLDGFGIYTSIRDSSDKIVDFRTDYVNEAACITSGIPREEQLGRHLFSEILPNYRATGLFDQCCQVLETGQPLIRELICEHLDNLQTPIRTFDIRVTKLDDGFAATWRDITERKQAEEKLKFQAYVLSQVNDAVLITEARLIDEPGPRILYVNDAFTRMTGYSLEEVVGKTPRILQGPKTDRKVLVRIRKAIVNCQPIMVELINYRKNGSAFWVEINIVPMMNETGECTHFIAVQRDISDRKQIEAEREQLLAREQAARAEAEAANRAKDDFLATVSHELRSPLHSILSWTRLLKNRKWDEATTKLALEAIDRNVKLQNQLIEDLMDISRMIRGHMRVDIEPIDLIPTLTAAINTVLPSADAKNITIKTAFDRSTGLILGDSSRLQQVFSNLLCNAVKFTPEEGHIAIRLERGKETAVPYPYAQITVSDTGIGISPDFLPYVFDQFRQAETVSNKVYGGLGLGLAIAKRLVELHSGTIAATSQGEGKGATFIVRLPLQTADS